METPPPLPGSPFVTAVAWVFIVLSAFATVISILQNVMIYTLLPVDQMHAALAQAREQQQQQMPAGALFIFEHIRALITSVLVITAGTLFISIGLLRCYNWARILFVVLLSLGIAWNIGGLFWEWFFFRSMPQPPQTPPDMQAQFRTMTTVMMIFSVAMAIGMSALFGWIIRRLTSPTIRNEFLLRST